MEQGNHNAAEELLPIVYEELRKLAAVRMAREQPGQTLQATALVHEAWLRLGADEQPQYSALSQGRGEPPQCSLDVAATSTNHFISPEGDGWRDCAN